MTPARRRIAQSITLLLGLGLAFGGTASASGAGYERISGSGSSWAGNAVAQWLADVKAQGVTVDYDPTGSSTGRKQFAQSLKQFAVSEIPYTGDTADPQDTTVPTTPYTLMPMVAGGTSFMYNLDIGGNRFTKLNLSQAAVAGIFSGQITRWNAPEIAADNPNVSLPAQQITVVVRSEGSGATAQFTLWMLRQFPAQYQALCATTGCNPAAATSYFPTNGLTNFVAQNGSSGVTTYTVNTPYTINYDEYSYALQVGFPVANVKNAAGFYTVPTAEAVAVALIQANINTDPASANYLAQDLSGVYNYGDPRTYPLSAYSYFIVPTVERGGFGAAQGATLGYFTQYALCEGQRTMGPLGYSPLPMNLVLAAMTEVRKIPGVDAATLAKLDAVAAGATAAGADNPCNNPTFKPGDDPARNVLVATAKFPAGCDAGCQAPWTNASTNAAVAPAGAGPVAVGGAVAPPTGTTAVDAPVPEEVCDPDTGVCATAEATLDSTSSVQAIPTVLAGQNGWAGPQTLMALVGALLVALVLAPPLVTRLVSKSRRGGISRP